MTRWLRIVLGCALVSGAYAFITVPMRIINGGVTSTSLILSVLTSINISVFVNGITWAILLICGIFLGRNYLLGSLLSCICYVGFFTLFHALAERSGVHWRGFLPLAVLVAAVLVGIGYGLCLSAEATVVGFDTCALILNKYWSWISVGKAMAVINCTVLMAGLLVFSWRAVAAGIVFSLIQSAIIDRMLAVLKPQAA